jgi:hypothetical protein
MEIKQGAGQLRGVRVLPDPKGILLSVFTHFDGIQYGYLVIPSEGEPAVYDGENWHSIHTGTSEDVATIAAQQYEAAVSAIEDHPEYQQIVSAAASIA